jgi:hypothetical protein
MYKKIKLTVAAFAALAIVSCSSDQKPEDGSLKADSSRSSMDSLFQVRAPHRSRRAN